MLKTPVTAAKVPGVENTRLGSLRLHVLRTHDAIFVLASEGREALAAEAGVFNTRPAETGTLRTRKSREGSCKLNLHLMQCRIDGIQQMIAGYAKSGVPLVAWNGQSYGDIVNDDYGLYYFIPRVADFTHTGPQTAAAIFFTTVLLSALVCGLIGSALLFKTNVGRLAAFAGMGLLAFFALHVGDVYTVAAAIVLATVPLFLYFAKQQRFSPAFGGFLFMAGMEIAAANWMRSHCGTGSLILIALVVLFGMKIAPKQKAALLACVLFGMAGPMLAFKSIQNRSEAFRAANQPGYQNLIQQHNFWHCVYIGFGYLDNPYGLAWDDGIARNKVASIDPNAILFSPEYERILRTETFRFVGEHPGFALKTVAVKTRVLLTYLLLYANIGLLAAWRYPKARILDIAFWLALGFGALPGLLVMPTAAYVMSFIAMAVVYSIVSINTALESPNPPAPFPDRSLRVAKEGGV